MTLNTSTIRPGLLVSLKTSITGNVRYDKRSLDNRTLDDGTSVVEWETTRTVFDPAEHKRATEVRQKARNLVASVCIGNTFMLCPLDREDKLREAVEKARSLARDFNATAKLSVVRIFIVTGSVADNDVEAIKAISSEVRDLYTAMAAGIENLDAEAVREAARKALSVGQMLSPKAAEEVKDAVAMARATARKIVKAGEAASQEIDYQTIEALRSRRTAFLDLDDMGTVAAPVAEGRVIDLDPDAGFDPRDPLASDGKEPLAKIKAFKAGDVVKAAKRTSRVQPREIEVEPEAKAASKRVSKRVRLAPALVDV